MKGRLPRGYSWEVQEAVREHKKGKAKEGMVVGMKTEIKGTKVMEGGKKEGIMMIKVWMGVVVESDRDVSNDIERKLRT